MKSLHAALISLALASTPATAQTLFSENWDDGAGATRWSAPLFALEDETIGPDGSIDYNFDYSVLGAASAPNSSGGTTTGVFMETNTTDDTPGDEGESVGIIPLGFTLPDTDFRLTSDLFLFWNGGGGSTEYATFGVHHQGSDNVPLRFNLNNGDGLAWQADTDGDSGTDILRFEGPGGESGLGGWEGIPDGSIPGVPTGGASVIGPFNQWVELSITSVAGTVEFAMNGFVIDTFDNTGGTFTGGTILIGHSDPFNSVNTGNPSNGAVFDNILVEAVTPPLAGDYNGNGVVDAADYTVYRDTLGDSVEFGSGADGNGNGVVDPGDYTVWANNFGSSNVAVATPEPTSSLLLLSGAVFAIRRHR